MSQTTQISTFASIFDHVSHNVREARCIQLFSGFLSQYSKLARVLGFKSSLGFMQLLRSRGFFLAYFLNISVRTVTKIWEVGLSEIDRSNISRFRVT